MLSASDLIHIPYTPDLTDGGIAYALHSIPYAHHRMGDSGYESLRHTVATAAVQLAFRRYLSDKNIPFEVQGAAPFTEHERHDVLLSGRRCAIQAFLISQRDQIAQLQRDPQVLLGAPALVASDQHAWEGHSPLDLYLFAFLAGHVTISNHDLQKVIETREPYYLVHVMPEAWNRPRKWNPLGRLIVKSESDETQTLEIGGQDEGRTMQSCTVELPPRKRVELPNGYFSLSYMHIRSGTNARIGIYSPTRKETYLIGTQAWGNIWVYGMQVVLTGYIRRDDFSRRANFVQTGSRVFQYNSTQVKNLAVPVSELKPLSELFEQARMQKD